MRHTATAVAVAWSVCLCVGHTSVNHEIRKNKIEVCPAETDEQIMRRFVGRSCGPEAPCVRWVSRVWTPDPPREGTLLRGHSRTRCKV